MTAKPVRYRVSAETDLRAAAQYLVGEGGKALARRFTAAVRDGVARIADNPAIGALRYALPAGVPGLRAWPLRDFPYLIFYRDLSNRIEVLRILHAHRDIPALLRDD